MRNFENAVEPQHALDALFRPRLRADPVIAHAHDDKRRCLGSQAMSARLTQVSCACAEIDPETLPVERDELERVREGHRLAREPNDVARTGAPTSLQPLEATIEVVNAIHRRLALGREAGDNQAHRGAQVGRHHRGADAAADAARPPRLAVEVM